MGCVASHEAEVDDTTAAKQHKWRGDSAERISLSTSAEPSLDSRSADGDSKGARDSKAGRGGERRNTLMDSAGSLNKGGGNGKTGTWSEVAAAAAALREPAASTGTQSSEQARASASTSRFSAESAKRTSNASSSTGPADLDQHTEMDHWDSGGAMRRLTGRTSFSTRDNRDGSIDIDRRNSMSYMKEVDSIIRSYDVGGEEVEICKHKDGTDVVLGRGTYGQVYQGLRDGVQDVAVKVLFETDEHAVRSFIQEISLLKSLNYDKNILQFYGCQLVAGKVPMMITEFMEGGDLCTAIDHDFKGQLKWNMRGFNLAMDIARGIHFLHAHNVIHSDLKTSNVLLDRAKSTAKIADVGLARVMTKKEYRLSDEHAWTFVYAAPEMLTGKPCDAKSDVYSMGVVLWELVMRERPIRGQLSKPNAPEDCPVAVANLISRCLKKDPSLRPSAKEVFTTIKEAHASIVSQSTW